MTRTFFDFDMTLFAATHIKVEVQFNILALCVTTLKMRPHDYPLQVKIRNTKRPESFLSMRPLSDFRPSNIHFVFSDIDDTLTDEGRLGPEAYQALWDLSHAGIKIIPITGRPAGWCELIARQWPVEGVVGENGGFYFRLVGNEMRRHFVFDSSIRDQNQVRLQKIRARVLSEVPSCRVASDQFSRLMDLAIDFAEDVKPPLPAKDVQKIVQIFEGEGATAKVSSIHVNGWFGDYDKLSMCRTIMQREFNLNLDQINSQCVFAGDSPNDEPMFGFFNNSIGVANVVAFADQIRNKPKFVTTSPGGAGFHEIAAVLMGRLS